jgi:hypothetical protein
MRLGGRSQSRRSTRLSHAPFREQGRLLVGSSRLRNRRMVTDRASAASCLCAITFKIVHRDTFGHGAAFQ